MSHTCIHVTTHNCRPFTHSCRISFVKLLWFGFHDVNRILACYLLTFMSFYHITLPSFHLCLISCTICFPYAFRTSFDLVWQLTLHVCIHGDVWCLLRVCIKLVYICCVYWPHLTWHLAWSFTHLFPLHLLLSFFVRILFVLGLRTFAKAFVCFFPSSHLVFLTKMIDIIDLPYDHSIRLVIEFSH